MKALRAFKIGQAFGNCESRPKNLNSELKKGVDLGSGIKDSLFPNLLL